MEPVLFKAREDGHGVRGAGLLGALSGAPSSSTIVLGLKQKGLAAKEGSRVPLLPARASGEGRDGLGREPHQWKKTFHISPERNQLHPVLMDVKKDKAAWEDSWALGDEMTDS